MGTWEREQVKDVKDATTTMLVGTGVGICALGVGGTYVAYKIGKAMFGWGEDIVDGMKGIYADLDESNVLSKSAPSGPVKLFFQIVGL